MPTWRLSRGGIQKAVARVQALPRFAGSRDPNKWVPKQEWACSQASISLTSNQIIFLVQFGINKH